MTEAREAEGASAPKSRVRAPSSGLEECLSCSEGARTVAVLDYDERAD
jgi:hypothetical protein